MDPAKEEVLHQFCEDPNNSNSLSQGATLTELAYDGAGQLWIGAWAGGLTKLNKKSSSFYNLMYEPGSNQIAYPPVTGLQAEPPSTLWIGTWGTGLAKWNIVDDVYKKWINSNVDGLNESIIAHLTKDNSGALWLSTYGQGLTKWSPTDNVISRFQSSASKDATLSSDFIRYSFVDSKNRLWVSTNVQGLNLINQEARQYIQFPYDGSKKGTSHGKVRQIVEDKSGTIWIGTVGGGLNRYNENDQSFTHYRFSEDLPTSLSGDIVSEVFLDTKNNLWIGTTSGLNKMETSNPGVFERYTMNDGLPNDVILAIEEDDFGRLWMSTFNGISCFYPNDKKFINYGLEEGLLDLELSFLNSFR